MVIAAAASVEQDRSFRLLSFQSGGLEISDVVFPVRDGPVDAVTASMKQVVSSSVLSEQTFFVSVFYSLSTSNRYTNSLRTYKLANGIAG